MVLCMVLCMAGCKNKSMNNIIENEPSITGTVTEIHDRYIQIHIKNDGYPNGADCNVSLDVENKDGIYSPICVGDKVVVYYDGCRLTLCTPSRYRHRLSVGEPISRLVWMKQ